RWVVASEQAVSQYSLIRWQLLVLSQVFEETFVGLGIRIQPPQEAGSHSIIFFVLCDCVPWKRVFHRIVQHLVGPGFLSLSHRNSFFWIENHFSLLHRELSLRKLLQLLYLLVMAQMQQLFSLFSGKVLSSLFGIHSL